jgi:cell division FtsZ-interacting protein ZapD
MLIGPFTISDAENLIEVFETKEVPFELVIDKEREKQILAQYHEAATVNPRMTAGTLNLTIASFEIADTDLEKIKDTLENFGIALTNSDGSFELGEDEN